MGNINDISPLINELGSSDAKTADSAGRAIIRIGPRVIPILIKFFPTSTTAIRRRLAFLFGELGRNATADPQAFERTLLDALKDEDWKVRRNAAISLGKAGSNALAQSILQTLETETDPRVRSSLILAFGKLAETADAASLSNLQLTTQEEQEAARKVADHFSAIAGDVPVIDADSPIAQQAAVELWCRSGLAHLVASEAADNQISAKVLAPDRVAIWSLQTLNQLFRIRSALFPALVFETQEDPANPRKMGENFASSPVAEEIVRLTEGSPVTYRLTVDLPTLRQRRRNWINDFAAGCRGLVNRATGYSWEVIVKSAGSRLLLGARPSSYPDSRFAYRKLDVPASVHPTLAAAAVRLAPTSASDVVLDPFCGSGTLLAERALLAPYSRLIGIDIDARALHAACTNLVSFERVILEQAEFSILSNYSPIDLVITNPPYGLRVSTPRTARRLYATFSAAAAKALTSGGALIALTPPSFPNPPGLQLIRRDRVDAGGLQVDLMLARKVCV